MTPSNVFRYMSDTDVVHILAFIGGLYDTAGYLKLNGVFTSSITGNLVVACSSITSSKGALCRSLVVLCFTLAGGVGSWLALRMKFVYEFNTRISGLILFSIVLTFMIAVWVIGLRFDEDISNTDGLNESHLILVACLMGTAMGFHNVAAKESIVNCPPTTVMTSTLINVSSHFSNTVGYFLASKKILSLAPYKTIPKEERTDEEEHEIIQKKLKNLEDKYLDYQTKLIVSSKPLLSFIAGGLVGAAVTTYATFYFNAITVFLDMVIILDIYLKESYEREVARKSKKKVINLEEGKPNDKNNVKEIGLSPLAV